MNVCENDYMVGAYVIFLYKYFFELQGLNLMLCINKFSLFQDFYLLPFVVELISRMLACGYSHCQISNC